MSSSDAQRSPVHHATEDSNAEASSPTRPTGPASTTPQQDARDAARVTPPERGARPGDAADSDPNDPDESHFGGPLDLDKPDAV